MNPTFLGVAGPGLLNQVPTLQPCPQGLGFETAEQGGLTASNYGRDFQAISNQRSRL